MTESRIVVITGCSSGFGLEMVESFLSCGDIVVATMRNATQRKDILKNLSDTYPNHLFIENLDVTSETQRKELVTSLHKNFGGRCDILVNNAGYGIFGALEDTSEKQIRDIFEVNFMGPTLLIKELLPLLRETKGRVINVSSLMGRSSLPLGGVYSASKYALEGLSEGLFYECAHVGVQVSTIQPGGHRTKFISSLAWGENAFDNHSKYIQLTRGLQSMMSKLSSREKAPGASKVAREVIKVTRKNKMPRAVLVGGDALFVRLLQAILPSDLYQRLTRRMYLRFFTRALK